VCAAFGAVQAPPPPALRATPLINAGGKGAVQWRMVSAATVCSLHYLAHLDNDTKIRGTAMAIPQ